MFSLVTLPAQGDTQFIALSLLPAFWDTVILDIEHIRYPIGEVLVNLCPCSSIEAIERRVRAVSTHIFLQIDGALLAIALDLTYEGCLSYSREIETAQFEVICFGVLDQIRQFMLQNVI